MELRFRASLGDSMRPYLKDKSEKEGWRYSSIVELPSMQAALVQCLVYHREEKNRLCLHTGNTQKIFKKPMSGFPA